MNIRTNDPRTVGPRIRMMMPHLTPLEARVVDTILGRRDFDGATPLKTVADDAGVSEAMVIKIAKKLGFAGFKDFRAALDSYNRLPTAELHQELSPDDTGRGIAEKVFRTSLHALEETLSIFDPDAFERAADLIFHARQRDLYGIGGSAQIARDVAHKFLRIGIRTSVFDDAHMMLMSAALLREGDVAIAFSHSGSTAAVLEPLELARKRGARTIALTNYAASPLAKLADVVLCSTAQGSPLLGENAAARIAQLVIFDAVFAAVAQRDLAAAERNLAATMIAVTDKRRTTGAARPSLRPAPRNGENATGCCRPAATRSRPPCSPSRNRETEMPENRPTIICHMASSIDGRLHPSRYTESPDGAVKDWSALYEKLHEGFGADAWIVGRVTMAEMAKGEPHPPAEAGPVERPCHVATGNADAYAVALDPSGKLHFRRPDIGGDAIVVLLGSEVADAHLAELAADGISYFISTVPGVDLGEALAVLKRRFGIETLLLEGGGAINGSFLAAGLVDELSVVVAPALDGAVDADGIAAFGGGLKGKVRLSLAGVERLDHGAVHMRYSVEPA